MKTIRAILALIFAGEGITKLLGLQFQVEFFQHWGYSMTFMYVIGALELAGAIGLLLPKTRLYATIGLLGIMVGAFYTHIASKDPLQNMGLAIVASVLLLIHLVRLLKLRM